MQGPIKILGSRVSGSGIAALVISNEEMKDTIKLVKSLEDSGLLINCITQTIENETKDKEVDSLVCYWVH